MKFCAHLDGDHGGFIVKTPEEAIFVLVVEWRLEVRNDMLPLRGHFTARLDEIGMEMKEKQKQKRKADEAHD